MIAASGRQSNASMHASYTFSEYFILPETLYQKRVNNSRPISRCGNARVPCLLQPKNTQTWKSHHSENPQNAVNNNTCKIFFRCFKIYFQNSFKKKSKEQLAETKATAIKPSKQPIINCRKTKVLNCCSY